MVSQLLKATASSALRAVLALSLLMMLMPAVAMVRTAAAEGSEAAVNAGANASADTNATNAAGAEGSLSGETKAQTAQLGTAVGGFWKLAWQKSWPFIKNTTLKFWALISKAFGTVGAIFKEIGGSVKVDANANLGGLNVANVNGSIEVQ